jgi:hypothetical protein
VANIANVLYYNTTTKEITYAPPTGGGSSSGIANGTSNISIATVDGSITGYVAGNIALTLGSTSNAVAIGVNSGTGGATQSVSVGYGSGQTNQGINTVAVGTNAGGDSQSARSVAIGTNAGALSQGADSVAIGGFAGESSQATNSIVINATGSVLNNTTANSLVVAPIRNDVANVAQSLYYNTTTKEVTYAPTSGGSSGNLTVVNGSIILNSTSTPITSPDPNSFYVDSIGSTNVGVNILTVAGGWRNDLSYNVLTKELATISTIAATVSTLPTTGVTPGSRFFVSDASTTTFNSIPVGGGGNFVPVFWNSNTNSWRIG